VLIISKQFDKAAKWAAEHKRTATGLAQLSIAEEFDAEGSEFRGGTPHQ
jgi:hypothetical protein